MANVVSRNIQSYLTLLAAQARHYAVLRLFRGLDAAAYRRLCLDAQVPALLGSDGVQMDCTLMAKVSFVREGKYVTDQLRFECHYDANLVISEGPLHWPASTEVLAYQLISQLVQWTVGRDRVTFIPMEETERLKPDRQRFYI